MVTPSFEHADDARAALREIVAEHGTAALSSPSAMTNLLKDLLPDAPGVARLLVAAAEDRVVERLREQLAQGLDAATAARLTASAFGDATLVSPQLCAWVVDEIGSAADLLPRLGVGTGAAAQTSPLSDPPDAPTIAGSFPSAQTTPASAQSGASAAEPVIADTTPVASAPPTVTPADASTHLGTSGGATEEITSGTAGPRRRKRGLIIGVLAAVVVLGTVIGLVVAASGSAQQISAAVLQGAWTTHYKVVILSGDDTTYLVGKKWSDRWTFTPDCGSGACNVRLSGGISGPGNSSSTPFHAELTRNGAVYSGTVVLPGFESCTVSGKQYSILSKISFRIKVISAQTRNNAWVATSWTGKMVTVNPRTPAGSSYCSADSWTTTISGAS